MDSKPTYEQLEQRLRVLEQEVFANKQKVKDLARAGQQKSQILDTLMEHVVYQNIDMTVL